LFCAFIEIEAAVNAAISSNCFILFGFMDKNECLFIIGQQKYFVPGL